jgi:hypothetical protein
MVEVVEIVFSTNYNCPSGTDDATIALSVRTLSIASEGDTSVPSNRSTGKPATAHIAQIITMDDENRRSFDKSCLEILVGVEEILHEMPTGMPPLIPREVLLGNPRRSQPDTLAGRYADRVSRA